MRGRTPRLEATQSTILTPSREACDQLLWVGYHTHRTVTRLDGLWKLTIVVRRCVQPECPRYHVAYRPEEEGRWALPHGEFGLEVIALIGQWRFREHRSVPEMHQALLARGVKITERSVTHLMQCYEELVALRITDQERIKARLQKQGHVILALDGLQPDVGHEVLWIIRDCLSEEILLARPRLRSTQGDLTALLTEVKQLLNELAVPVKGIISDGVISTLSVKTCMYVCYVTRKVALQADRDVVDATKRKRKSRMETLRSIRSEQSEKWVEITLKIHR
ncbi:hypothetical protein ccbrp13_70060 [Ktedonobacteria bacterium brp13]|nr:hypothetical protein ccbrp13_70060 [Ktedonobacteria bacterium brp13]